MQEIDKAPNELTTKLKQLQELLPVGRNPGTGQVTNARAVSLRRDVLSVMKRLESSQWFAGMVTEIRSTGKPNLNLVRYIEAFIFFSRSVLDCVAFLLYDICGLDVEPGRVYIQTVAAKVENVRKWAELEPVLHSLVISPWFTLLNGLRNTVTHRMILYTAIEHTIGANSDRLLIPSDPYDPVVSCMESGIDVSEYVRDVMRPLTIFVEEVAAVLVAYVQIGKVSA